MNVFRDTDDSTADDRKMRRSLAASIARHEAAVETLKWHMEMDDYDDYDDSVGRRRALYSEDQRDYWSDDAAPRTAARYPTDSRWDSDRHFRADERIEDPRLVGVGSVGRKFSPYWSDDNGFRVDAKLTSTRAARLPTALELDDERNAGVRAYLERKLRDYQPLQPPAIHSARTVQLPSPPQTPRLSTPDCTGNGCCWNESCSRFERYELEPADFEQREAVSPMPPTDELVAARYEFGRWASRPSGVETSLDGPANWPYACRPFFFRRADTPSARYY
ncbi:hypothetical protein BOX15_Mlig008912g2 [Macrostomum lignano]|uniref:Uncharacterized protein n=1 Tax=Macrostomum lignano TaxID=282301 RepID=A0A267DR64_9PLAT|nr:hypothetical protein BOX15_Mlig008912g2 [Macrostomum lignano]